MEVKNLEAEEFMLARMIFILHQVKSFVHGGWNEFEDEANSLEKKIHQLWREAGREDAPTGDLMIWAQSQGISF